MIPIHKRLLLENKAWAKEKTDEDPEFFARLAKGQQPKILWIGCSDSRIPANEITNTQPGDLFVHRNIANLVIPNDPNLLSVIQYSVGVLGIEHIIICGHSHCGGVRAAVDNMEVESPLKDWLSPLVKLANRHRGELNAIKDPEERVLHLAKLNVLEQVELLSNIPFVQKRWEQRLPLSIHGWVFNIDKGMLEEVSISSTVSSHQHHPIEASL